MRTDSIVYLIIRRPGRDSDQFLLCPPSDKLIDVVAFDEPVYHKPCSGDDNIRIEKHECEGAEIGKIIYVQFKHVEPNAPWLMGSEVYRTSMEPFTKDQLHSNCDMAYSYESQECIIGPSVSEKLDDKDSKHD